MPEQLSGGQQQRVAIARALAMEPAVLLCDEITSALDPELVGEVLRVVESLADEGMTLLMVTHEMGFARKVSDRVIFMHQGRVHEMGAAAGAVRQPEDARAAAVPVVAERLSRSPRAAQCRDASVPSSRSRPAPAGRHRARARPARPPGRARPGAREHPARVRESAGQVGVDTLELDIGVTADGVVVVSHDVALNPAITRDAAGAWLASPGPLIRSLTLQQLQAYDVGRVRPDSAYGRGFPAAAAARRHPHPDPGGRCSPWSPAKGAPVRFNIETKIDANRPDDTVSPEAMATALLKADSRTPAWASA
jgi:hypothetical protein